MIAQPPSNPPPPGGYGAGPRAGFGPAPKLTPAPAGKGRTWVPIVVSVGAVVFSVGTIGLLLSSFMIRKRDAARQIEVKLSLGQMAKDALTAYEGDRMAGGETRQLCRSASRPVPADPALIRGKKYQSNPEDWAIDKPRAAGFACLRFEMTAPQFYMYRYEATSSSFVAGGRGDLDGDGKLSDFMLRGEVRENQLRLSPRIDETDPYE